MLALEILWGSAEMKFPFTPFYSTSLGHAYLGDSLSLMRKLPSESVNLILTSPPYALHFKKEYGNKSQAEYVAWFMGFAEEFFRLLRPDGSLVIDLGVVGNKDALLARSTISNCLSLCVKKPVFTLLRSFIGTTPLSYHHLLSGSLSAKSE